MDPVTARIHIARPREELFAYLADIANHPEFCDHFLTDWRLTREDSTGTGAGARFALRRRFDRFAFGDITLSSVSAPWQIVARGRSGKFNRIRMLIVWELQPSGSGTDITVSFETQPANPADQLAQLGMRRWSRRGWDKALKRLRAIHEHGEQRGARATISGGARKPATPQAAGRIVA